MEGTSWNLQHGSYLIEPSPCTIRHGTYTMEATSWNLYPGSYLVEVKITEVTSWNLYPGRYLVEVTPWK